MAAASCLLIAISIVLLASSSPTLQALSIVIAFGLFAGWVVRLERSRWGTIGGGAPICLFAVSWFVFFGIFGLGAFDLDYPVNLTSSQILFAMVIALLSLVLVAVGYRVALIGAVGNVARFVGDATQPINSRWAIFVCLLIGWIARIFRFELGLFGFVSSGQEPTGLTFRALQLGDGLIQVGLVLLALAAWSKFEHPTLSRSTAKALLAVNVLPLLVITGLASGVKAQLITDLLPVGIMYLMLKARVPWKAVALLLVYLVVLYSGVGSFREDIARGRLTQEERTGLLNTTRTVVDRITDSWVEEPIGEQISNFWEGVTGEYGATPSNLAIVLDRTPTFIPHTGVARLFYAPVFFVPTKILGASQINVGQYFATTYLRSTATTSAFPTQPGDLYMAGGWTAVIIGQLLVGIFLGLVWRFLVVRRMTNRSAALYAVLAANFANAGLDFGTLTRTILQIVVGYGLVLYLLLREPRRPVQEEPLPHSQIDRVGVHA